MLIAMLWVIRHSPYWPRSTETDRVGEVIVRITEEREERRGRITGAGNAAAPECGDAMSLRDEGARRSGRILEADGAM